MKLRVYINQLSVIGETMLTFNELLIKHVLPAAPASDIATFNLFFKLNTNFYLPAGGYISMTSGYSELYFTFNKQITGMPSLEVDLMGNTVWVQMYVEGCLRWERVLQIDNEAVRRIILRETMQARRESNFRKWG